MVCCSAAVLRINVSCRSLSQKLNLLNQRSATGCLPDMPPGARLVMAGGLLYHEAL